MKPSPNLLYFTTICHEIRVCGQYLHNTPPSFQARKSSIKTSDCQIHDVIWRQRLPKPDA